MLEIFIVEDQSVKPTPQILLLSPFKEIWEDDKVKGKGKALNKFRYVEFMVSPLKTNPYKDYNTEEKHVKVCEKVFGGPYEPDTLVKQACEQYEKWIYEASFSFQFLQAAKEGALHIKKFLLKPGLDERTKSGGAVIKAGDVTRALKDTEDILKNVQNLEKKVHEELSRSKTQGNKDINIFEK